jgi:hypothetical protein
MELENALDQIAEIHRQISRTQTFRGYRSATTLFTACAAAGASVFQGWWLPDVRHNAVRFVDLWVCIAVGCLVVVAAEMIQRCRRTDSPLQRQLTLQAVEQFLPGVVAGGLITLVLVSSAPNSVWLLPGLWSILFGLCIFSSRQLLPRPVIFVAGFYLLCGVVGLTVFQGDKVFSPWFMGISFGTGQAAAACILYWSLERQHES